MAADSARAQSARRAPETKDAAAAQEAHGAADLAEAKSRRTDLLDGWHVEPLYEDYGQALKVSETLYDATPDEQHIQVIRNPRFGKVLLLDGIVQTTEADEFIYHEMLTHVPILAHGSAKRVLIIGGGDGGMLRECLRHRSVEKVVMVEIDASVVEFSKQHLPHLSQGAFDDPRTELVIADGAAYMDKGRGKFDVIILDRPDPVGPALALFTDAVYAACKRRLKKGGVLVAQNGVPFVQATELRETITALKPLFDDVSAYLATVPTYFGGPMAFSWASDAKSRRVVSLKKLEERYKDAKLRTRYYTPSVHKAAFALPGYVADLVS